MLCSSLQHCWLDLAVNTALFNLNRTKFYHELRVVKSLVYLLLTHFEPFSLVQSICKDYKKHFEQDLVLLITASVKLHSKVIFKKQPPGKQPDVI